MGFFSRRGERRTYAELAAAGDDRFWLGVGCLGALIGVAVATFL